MLKDAGLVIEERDAGFTYFRLADTAKDGLERSGPRSRSSSQRPRAIRRCRRTRRGCRKCCGCGKRTSSNHVAATRATGGSSCPAGAGRPGHARSACCCRRCASRISAAARAISRSRRRAGPRRVIAVDRSEVVLARARALGLRRRATERRVEARRAGEAADRGCDGRCGAAVAGAAPRLEPGACGGRGGAHHRAGRTRAGAGFARASGRMGAREARRSSRWDSKTRSSRACCRDAA